MVSLIVAITRSCSTAPPGLDRPAEMFHHRTGRARMIAQLYRGYVVVRSDTML